MQDYTKRPQGGRGGFTRGGARGPKTFDRNVDNHKEMFKVTCSECGQGAEVPFKPTGDKPVLCKDCYAKEREKHDGPRSERRSFPRDVRDRRSFGTDPKIHEQLDALNKKLDRILKTLGIADVYEKKDIFRAPQKPLARKTPKYGRPEHGALKKAVEDAAALEE